MTSSGSSDVRDGGPLQGVRVLVVEDNRQVAEALKSSLTDTGMAVAGPADTAIEAQRLVIEGNPELALVDLNLKGELATDLINWLHRRGLRIIVMSGMTIPPKSVSKGAAFLQKPFGADELFAAVHQVMLASA
jgi:DNA-binding response OmpR family regulator